MCRAAEAQAFVGYRTGHWQTGSSFGSCNFAVGFTDRSEPGVAIASSWAVRLEPFLGTRRKSKDTESIKLRVIAASRSGRQRRVTVTPLNSFALPRRLGVG